MAITVELVTALACPHVARASSLTVPDDIATIQGAVDANVDTILVRAGDHLETPTMPAKMVLLGIPGEPGFERPVLTGLWVLGEEGPLLRIRDLVFREQVRISNTTTGSSIFFENCHFLGGIFDSSSDPTTSFMTFRSCRIQGDASLQAGGECVLDSCVVEGHLLATHSDVNLVVTDCEFRGDGIGTGIASRFAKSATVMRTVIAGYGVGIRIPTESGVRVEGNTVRDCTWAGISCDNTSGDVVTRNRVDRCGKYGVYFTGGGQVVENIISNCGDTGLLAGIYEGRISGNVVYGCGRLGVDLAAGGGLMVEVRNNVSALNIGSGFRIQATDPYATYELTGNVGFRNTGWGIDWWRTSVNPVVRCNDWFGNTLGDVGGRAPSALDLHTDPLFCDPANGDFHPSAVSPLVNVPGCGLVGALGVGCTAPGVQGDAFRLARVGPNPSVGAVTIEFEMPRAAAIDVEVFDVLGRRVAAPARGRWPAGRHSVVWAPRSGGAGIYLVRFRFPGGEERRRLVRTP